MPKNFPEVWLGQVEKQLTSADVAPWLDGIPELAVDVSVFGEGTETEKNTIYLPLSTFEPKVLVNNTTYPIALVDYSDGTATINLDKYQTEATNLTDDEVLGASYDKIKHATDTHTVAINTNKYKKAIHALAPGTTSANTPIIKTSGAVDLNGRKIITRLDIIAMKDKFDKMDCPIAGRRLVLSTDHVNDLLTNDQKFADQYYAYTSGKISNLFGFEVYEYVANPYFNSTTLAKLAFGAIPTVNDFQASVAFYAPNIAKKTGMTKQYFAESKSDPQNQTNKVNYRHYFITIPKRIKYLGVIVSSK